MCLNKVITGKQKPDDYKLAEMVDYDNLDVNHAFGTYIAWKYIDKKQHSVKDPSHIHAAIIMAFGIGCILVSALWYIATNYLNAIL